MTDLNELLERVKKATGPDRHLDALIEVEARRQEAYAVGLDDCQRAYWQTNAAGTVFEGGTIYAAPLFTDSIDAALALVERVLPGWMWTIYHEYVITEKPNVVFLKHKNVDLPLEIGEARGDHETVPLAILAALLSALISKEAQS